MRSNANAPSSAGAAAWPAWFAPVGLFVAFGATLVVQVVLQVAYMAVGGEAGSRPPELVVLGTLGQDVALIGTAVGLAAVVSRPRPRDFGLRPPAARHALIWLVGAAAGFYALSSLYGAVVQPEGEQDTAELLGAERGLWQLVAAGVVVILLAPVAEEVFFRGFFYRALRNRLSTAGAIAVVAAVFGAIHYSGPETLLLLPVLALLGAVFCVLYERTGSLYPAIALHALNNTIALAVTVDTDAAAPVAATLGALTLAGCATLPYVQRRAATL